MDLDNKYLKLYAEDNDIDLSTLKQIDGKKMQSVYNSYLSGWYCDQTDTIFICNKNNNKSWLYYAGFEYIDEQCIDSININGFFLAIYFKDSRVDKVIELMNE